MVEPRRVCAYCKTDLSGRNHFIGYGRPRIFMEPDILRYVPLHQLIACSSCIEILIEYDGD